MGNFLRGSLDRQDRQDKQSWGRTIDLSFPIPAKKLPAPYKQPLSGGIIEDGVYYACSFTPTNWTNKLNE